MQVAACECAYQKRLTSPHLLPLPTRSAISAVPVESWGCAMLLHEIKGALSNTLEQWDEPGVRG